ncbi:MAG: MalY/PatB family protein [Candidatus Thorarchaeota archaeon]
MSSFDEIIDRSGTGSVKWDPAFLKEHFGHEDLLPLWVADMDFRTPQTVIDALENRARHGIFGYTFPGSEYSDSVINWFRRRHGWSINKKWIVFSPGVVPAVTYMVQRFTQPGDHVIIQHPVYHPFMHLIEHNGRQIVSNQLKMSGSRYQMDFEDLEEKAKDPRSKLFILCSPHNPVGRVWSKDELYRLGDICLENNLLVIADEIWCDLILPGHQHTPFASISEKFAQNSITCTSGSKTFNLAGLQNSNILIPNDRLREDFKIQMEKLFLFIPNSFGSIALQVAYETGEEWLNSVISVINRNLSILKSFVTNKLPKVSVIEPEGTYLVWLDFRLIGLNPKELQDKLLTEAKVALDSGDIFGTGGEGFLRINIACPRSILEEALERIANVF